MIAIAKFWLQKYLQKQLKNFFNAIDDLQKKIFLIYLKRDYVEHHLVYEKELHQQREAIFITMQHIRNNLRKLRFPLNDHLENLFELVVTLGNLRYRIKDHTTFEVCEKDFRNISHDISVIIGSLLNKTHAALDVSKFTNDIELFEDMNRGTLQMVVNDPVIFLIFIQNLYAIKDEFVFIAADVKKYE